MKAKVLILKSALILVLTGSAPVLMASNFNINATNATMATSGIGISKFTIASIPVTGTMLLNCSYSGTGTGKDLPICPLTPRVVYQVTAGGTLSGQVAFYPWGVPIPADAPAKEAGLAIAILLAAGVRRSGRRLLTRTFGILVCGAALACVTSCGGSNSKLGPPGTYPYTITAVNSPSPGSGTSYSVSTTIQLTVP